MTTKENERMKRIISNKIKRGQFTQIKRNSYFKLFSKKLNEYFMTHNMPVSLELIGHEAKYYTNNENIKMSKWVIKIWDQQLCNITIIPHTKGIELYRLEMYKVGTGLGSLFMNAFNEVSKQTGVIIYLVPGDPGFNRAGDENKRREFYHKFGFKRLKNSRYWSNELIIEANKYNL